MSLWGETLNVGAPLIYTCGFPSVTCQMSSMKKVCKQNSQFTMHITVQEAFLVIQLFS